MNKLKTHTLTVIVSVLFLLVGTAGTASAQEVQEKGVFFSTEEDFVAAVEAPDGSPIVSDGDLLHSSGYVYMRNNELLKVFKVEYDLGLDAADVLNVKERIVAFSTELDHPDGAFTAGDLLGTNGAIIPNAALLAAFNVPPDLDLGLDAVQFVGEEERVIQFLDFVRQRGRKYWLDDLGRLKGYLHEYNLDVWFSTEGTAPSPQRPGFLDGDLLSAANGTIVLSNRDALPVSVPAGIRDRGVDFGMDAVTCQSRENLEKKDYIFYSTEILFEGQPMFTDGDILRSGNGVVLPNSGLVTPFKPKTDFLGLDALSFAEKGPIELYPQITHFNRVKYTEIDNNGLAFVDKQPFGNWIQIDGHIPNDVDQFRVVFCIASSWPCSPVAVQGIPVTSSQNWHVLDKDGFGGCSGDRHWYSLDADGWYDAAEYRKLRDCNPSLPLTMWKSQSAPDPDGLCIVWLEYRKGAVESREPVNHYIQLDNKKPEDLLVEPKTGSICGQFGPGDMPLMVKGRFYDKHVYWYQLSISGGNPWASKGYSKVYHYTSLTDNVGPTGTIPGPPTMVDLHEVDINHLPPASIDDCAYTVGLWVYDRTIRGGFTPATDYRVVYGNGWHSYIAFTFDYTP